MLGFKLQWLGKKQTIYQENTTVSWENINWQYRGIYVDVISD